MYDRLYKQIREVEDDETFKLLKTKVPILLRIMAEARKSVEMILPSAPDDTFDVDADEIPDVR